MNNESNKRRNMRLNNIDLSLLNLSEVRRRSITVWLAIPENKLNWKSDTVVLNCKK